MRMTRGFSRSSLTWSGAAPLKTFARLPVVPTAQSLHGRRFADGSHM